MAEAKREFTDDSGKTYAVGDDVSSEVVDRCDLVAKGLVAKPASKKAEAKAPKKV